MNCDDTLTKEHDRLQRRTTELCEATEALAGLLRTHYAALREHIDRQRARISFLEQPGQVGRSSRD
jgi:hypothetical protein